MELTDSERGVIISLRDDQGAFLVCQPEETEERGASHKCGGSGAPIDLAVEKKPLTHSGQPEEEKATETSSSRSDEEESVVSTGNHCKQSQTCSNRAKEGTESKTRNRREGWRRSDHGDSFPESQNDGPRSGAVLQPTRRRREVIYVPRRKKLGSPGVIPKKRRQLLPLLEEASPELMKDPAELEGRHFSKSTARWTQPV